MQTEDEKTNEKNYVTEPCYCILCNEVAFGVKHNGHS